MYDVLVWTPLLDMLSDNMVPNGTDAQLVEGNELYRNVRARRSPISSDSISRQGTYTHPLYLL